MPYRTNHELPPTVRSHLPADAQDIYREAFNNAYREHAGEQDRERPSHMIAWAAVKRCYVREGDEWVLKQPANSNLPVRRSLARRSH